MTLKEGKEKKRKSQHPPPENLGESSPVERRYLKHQGDYSNRYGHRCGRRYEFVLLSLY